MTTYCYDKAGNLVRFVHPLGDGAPYQRPIVDPRPLLDLLAPQSKRERRWMARHGRSHGPGRRRAVRVQEVASLNPTDLCFRTETLVCHRRVWRQGFILNGRQAERGGSVYLYLVEGEELTPEIEADLLEMASDPDAREKRRSWLLSAATHKLYALRDPCARDMLLREWTSGDRGRVVEFLTRYGQAPEALAAVKLALANDREQRKARP